jgi:hypothetical protein
MIIATVAIVHDYALLRYYLQHYRICGVERFFIACDSDDLDASGALTAFLGSQIDVVQLSLSRRFRRSRIVGATEEDIRRQVATPQDWVVPADLDEFNQFPLALADLAADLDAGGFTHVTGHLADRLAPEGHLARLEPFDNQIPIWDQYPLVADATSCIVEGTTEKVLLSRGDLPLWLGHHRLGDNAPNRPHPYVGEAHHFKWRDGLEATVEWRLANESKVSAPWRHESENLASYLSEHGRIRPEDTSARIGWAPTTKGFGR